MSRILRTTPIEAVKKKCKRELGKGEQFNERQGKMGRAVRWSDSGGSVEYVLTNWCGGPPGSGSRRVSDEFRTSSVHRRALAVEDK
jgi:hypothetical protein